MNYPAIPRPVGYEAVLDKLVLDHWDRWHEAYPNKECPECDKQSNKKEKENKNEEVG